MVSFAQRECSKKMIASQDGYFFAIHGSFPAGIIRIKQYQKPALVLPGLNFYTVRMVLDLQHLSLKVGSGPGRQ